MVEGGRVSRIYYQLAFLGERTVAVYHSLASMEWYCYKKGYYNRKGACKKQL